MRRVTASALHLTVTVTGETNKHKWKSETGLQVVLQGSEEHDAKPSMQALYLTGFKCKSIQIKLNICMVVTLTLH